MIIDEDFNYRDRLFLYWKNNTPVCEDVNRMINEELTINDNVIECAREVGDFIKESFYNRDGWVKHTETIHEEYGESYRVSKAEKLVKFSIVLLKKEFFIKAAMFNYSNKKSKRYYKSSDIEVNSLLDDKKTVVLTIKAIDGNFDWSLLYYKCMHELTHAMQFIHELPKTDEDLYKVACEFFNSENQAERAIGRLVYYSDPHEMAAFGNSLYSELESSFDMDISIGANFIGTKTHNVLADIKHCIDFIKANEKEVCYVLERPTLKGMITYGQLVKKGEWAYRELIRKCGKIIMKYQKDNDKVLRF